MCNRPDTPSVPKRTTRLDRFIDQHSDWSKGDTRLLLAQKRIRVDGEVAHSIQQRIDPFALVELDGQLLQQRQPVYLAFHKPAGVVSATKDTQHRTVLDCIDHPQRDELHIAGRLDFNSTGLVLLTNDGAWSRRISQPDSGIDKIYEVNVAEPLTEHYITAFREGIYFGYEDITTRPAVLDILSEYRARVTLHEGKYHQIKRMFGAFQNEVLALHRVSVGPIELGTLAPGETRHLSSRELQLLPSV